MYKKLTLVIMCISLQQARALDEWQLWIDTGIKGNPLPRVETFFDQEIRIRKNMTRFEYLELDPTVFFEFNPGQSIGFQARQIFEITTAGPWKPEEQPTLMLRNSFKIGPIGYYSTLRFLYRFREDRNTIGAIRFRPGVTFFEWNDISLYADNEFFYNYNGFQQYDQNRITFGIKGPLIGPIQWGLYYLHQSDKSAPGARWSNNQVIGIMLRGVI